MWPGKRCLGIVAGLAWSAAPAAASDMGARATARGGVGLADGGDAAGESQNLAAVALDPRYVLYAGAGLGPDGYFLARGGAVDTKTAVVAMGAGYSRLADNVAPSGDELPGWKDPDAELGNPTTWQRVNVGLAVPMLGRRLSIGVSGRHDWRTSALSGDDQAFNFGVSVAGRPIEMLTLAAGGRNLLGANYARVTREVDLAARFTPGPNLGVEADISAPADEDFAIGRFTWRAGFDVGALDWLALRGGWSLESTTHYASAGLGLVNEKVVLDYGVKVQLDDPARNWHGLDLRVNF
jgi:hypothetical protein